MNAALASGANDGTSWADAFQGSIGLQAALAATVPGDQIWVAQGNYKPTAGSDRLVSFVLRTGIEIYGGFAGGETSLGQRDFVAYVTTLTGDLNGDDGSNQFSENSCHVLITSATDASAVLDGLAVRGGNANVGFQSGITGGGILCDGGAHPTVRNCLLTQNRATAGAGCYLNNASPSFTDCRFEWNIAGTLGGGIGAYSFSAPSFLRCIFRGNIAGRGGGLSIEGACYGSLTNCVCWGNMAAGPTGGGAICVLSSNPVIRQCVIASNVALQGTVGGIRAAPPIELANDIIYFNSGAGGWQDLVNNVQGGNCTWCCVQGIGPGAGNISADPRFVNLASGDVHISQLSPCADAGDNQSVPAGTSTDLDGNPRLADDPLVPETGQGLVPIVDIGAYELPNTLYQPFCSGDGSLPTACPCGNTGAAGHGCFNSDIFAHGALLTVSGAFSPDTAVLSCDEMVPASSCIFLQGDQQDPAGTSFGDGVRCVAGSIKRLYVKTASLGAASAPGPGDPSVSARSAALGDPIAPGTQRYYQVYYRDSNLAFCYPPQGESWNISSGLIVYW